MVDIYLSIFQVTLSEVVRYRNGCLVMQDVVKHNQALVNTFKEVSMSETLDSRLKSSNSSCSMRVAVCGDHTEELYSSRDLTKATYHQQRDRALMYTGGDRDGTGDCNLIAAYKYKEVKLQLLEQY
ncbi:hypothetical protein DPMN_110524 [Dreissena polymorpha]|uniref:Uncharacterized protein n=1 Tax=Dreissena polymorpha TaxID=45954 RepID=A0A9D4KCR3_DREPO|nr:hypothetical protein DPMN_110524 [Dreissena polymorpha]